MGLDRLLLLSRLHRGSMLPILLSLSLVFVCFLHVTISFVWFNSQLRVFYSDRECFVFFQERIVFVVVSVACLVGLSDF